MGRGTSDQCGDEGGTEGQAVSSAAMQNIGSVGSGVRVTLLEVGCTVTTGSSVQKEPLSSFWRPSH